MVSFHPVRQIVLFFGFWNDLVLQQICLIRELVSIWRQFRPHQLHHQTLSDLSASSASQFSHSFSIFTSKNLQVNRVAIQISWSAFDPSVISVNWFTEFHRVFTIVFDYKISPLQYFWTHNLSKSHDWNGLPTKRRRVRERNAPHSQRWIDLRRCKFSSSKFGKMLSIWESQNFWV